MQQRSEGNTHRPTTVPGTGPGTVFDFRHWIPFRTGDVPIALDIVWEWR